MRRLLAILAIVAVGVVVPFVLVRSPSAVDDPSGSDRFRAQLAWKETPRIIRVEGLPRDRVLTGRLANESRRPAELSVDHVTVVDAEGGKVKSSVRFLSAFAHGLFSAESINLYGQPGARERRRLGEIATLKSGDSIPITLSWRVPKGAAKPVRVDFGGSSVKLP